MNSKNASDRIAALRALQSDNTKKKGSPKAQKSPKEYEDLIEQLEQEKLELEVNIAEKDAKIHESEADKLEINVNFQKIIDKLTNEKKSLQLIQSTRDKEISKIKDEKSEIEKLIGEKNVQITTLQEKLSENEKNISEKSNVITKLTEEKKSLQKICNSKDKQLSTISSQNNENITIISNMINEKELNEQVLKELNDKITTLTENISSLIIENADFEKNVKKKETLISRLTNEKSDFEKKFQEKETLCSRLTNEKSDVEKKILELQKENDKINATLKDKINVIKEKEVVFAHLHDTFSSFSLAKGEEIENMRSLLELKEHDLLKILTEYSNVEKELEETKRKITILDKDIFENNSTIVKLNQEKTSLENMIVEKDAFILKINNDKSIIENLLISLRNEKTSFEKKLVEFDYFTEENSRMKSEIDILKTEKLDLENSLIGNPENVLGKLMKENILLNTDISTKKSYIDNLEKLYREKESENENMSIITKKQEKLLDKLSNENLDLILIKNNLETSVNTLTKKLFNCISEKDNILEKNTQIEKLLNIYKPICPPMNEHTGSVYALAVAGGRIFTAGQDRTIKMWDILTGNKVGNSLTGHTDTIWTLAVRGEELFSGSADKTIRVWDIVTGKPLVKSFFKREIILKGHTDEIRNMIVFNERLLISGSTDLTIRIWNINKYQQLAIWNGHTNTISAMISHDKNLISAGALFDNEIRIWSLENGKFTKFPGITSIIESMVIYENFLFTSGSGPNQNDKIILKWDLSKYDGKFVNFTVPIGRCSAMTINNKRLFAAYEDRIIRVWNIEANDEMIKQSTHLIKTLSGHSGIIYSMITYGNRLISCSEDKSVQMWQI